ncbi:unnamed protein product, partial [Prorocentrum cordatum]
MMAPAPHCDEAARATRSSTPWQPDAKPMDAKLMSTRMHSLASSLTSAGDDVCSWGGSAEDDEVGEACVFMPNGSWSFWAAFSLDGHMEEEE